MLLPPQFQTPTPAPLGAKVVAIAPAPKPHVHQWLAVPDSKIHSRCAECGTVTLTEIVAPKPVSAFMPKPAPADEISDSALTATVRDFLNSSADCVRVISHARSVLDEMGFKKAIDLPQHRRAEFLKALTTWPQRHYTSIAAFDGKVRMVETDAEGWIKNDGTQPVADDVKVQCRLRKAKSKGVAPAGEWSWRDEGEGAYAITHWRPAA